MKEALGLERCEEPEEEEKHVVTRSRLRRTRPQREVPGSTEENEVSEGEDDFVLHESDDEEMGEGAEGEECAFCGRRGNQLLGPFRFQARAVKSEFGRFANMRLRFHEDCLRFNRFTKLVNGRWTGLRKAVERYCFDKTQLCVRCGEVGATIECTSCGDAFHAHQCAAMRMLLLPRRWLCFVCLQERLNKQPAQEAARRLQELFEETNFFKEIPRAESAHTEAAPELPFIPQAGDHLYFFAHGYEAFAGAHAFYFFNGSGRDEDERRVLEARPEFPQPLLCRVQSAKFRLPSALTFFLDKNYGEELAHARAGESLEPMPYSFDSAAGT